MKLLKGYRPVTKKNQQRLFESMEVIVAKRNCIKIALVSCYKLMKSEDMACNNLEHAGALYDHSEANINRDYKKNIDYLNLCFDSFVFDDPLTILYGNEGAVNFRRCHYGDTNSYRCAIENHVHTLEEIMSSLPYFLAELKDLISDYINDLYKYYRLVSAVA